MKIDNRLYTYAYQVAIDNEKEIYVIPNNNIAIPVSKTPEDAFREAKAHLKSDLEKVVILEISDLVECGIISKGRLFGPGIRKD